MSWAGRRPLKPDSLHPYPYNDHGIIYVTADDLHLSRALIFSALALMTATFFVSIVGNRLDSSFR